MSLYRTVLKAVIWRCSNGSSCRSPAGLLLRKVDTHWWPGHDWEEYVVISGQFKGYRARYFPGSESVVKLSPLEQLALAME